MAKYKALKVYTPASITIGEGVGVKSPVVSLKANTTYSLQFKVVMKSSTKVLDYIYAGDLKLASLNITEFDKTGCEVDGYSERLCHVQFTTVSSNANACIMIGRLLVNEDTPKKEILLIRDVQLQEGKMTAYTSTDTIEIWETLNSKIEQLSGKIDMSVSKVEYDKTKQGLESAKASITIQSGLIESKVSSGDFSTLIRQSPFDIQYAFNGVNARYMYTDDGLYMKADNGNNKASLKRGSFYCYNYNNGEFLGGLTPFVFENDAGTGIMNGAKSRFFVIGRDSTLNSDENESASNFNTFLTLNFTDRTGEGSYYSKGLQVTTPTYFHDSVSFTGHDLTSVNAITAQTLNVAGETHTDKLWSNHQYCSYLKDRFGYQSGSTWINGRNVFYFGEYDCTNYRNWDWQAKNIYNAVWVDASDRTLKESIVYEKDTTKYYNFIKDDYIMARYNYIGDERTKISAIAQDIIYNLDGTDNEVGQLMVNCKQFMEQQHTIGIDQNQLLNVTIGALQEAIKKIEFLEEEIKLLKE